MFVHIDNRRLDEWVNLERFDLTQKIEDQAGKEVTSTLVDVSDGTDRKITRNQKRKHDEINHVQKVLFCLVEVELCQKVHTSE